MALCNGNTTKASRELAKQGTKIPARTLWGWAREDHVQRYREIQGDVIPEIHARLADQSEALALQHGEVEAQALERLKKELPDVPVRDLSTAARNLPVSRGIATDESVTLRGRDTPAESNPIEDVNEVLTTLARLGVHGPPKQVPTLEGEATEEEGTTS